jgi:hypothetical protein
VAAAFLHHLVFDVHAGDVGADHFPDAARDVECTAPADIDIDQQRQIAGVGNATRILEHVGQGADAEIRGSERAGGDAAARQVNGSMAAFLRHDRAVGVDRADYLQRVVGVHGLAQCETWRVNLSHVDPRVFFVQFSRRR